MDTAFQPQLELEHTGPEVRAYIYQVISEFEPFTTGSTTVTVVAKDPLKVSKQDLLDRPEIDDLQKKWRIAISLTEAGTQLEEEGLTRISTSRFRSPRTSS